MPVLLRFSLPAFIFCLPLILKAQHCTLSAILPESLDTISEVIMIHSEVVSFELSPNLWETRITSVPSGDSIPVLTPSEPLWVTENLTLEVFTDTLLQPAIKVPFVTRPSYLRYQCKPSATRIIEKEVQIADPYIRIDIRNAPVNAVPLTVEVLPPLPFLVLENPEGQYMAPGIPAIQYTAPVYDEILAMVQASCDDSGIPGSGCIDQVYVPARIQLYDYRQISAFPVCEVERISADTLWLNGGNAVRPWYGEKTGTADKNIVEANYHIQLQPASVDTQWIAASLLEFNYEQLMSPATITILTRPAEYETIERMVLKDTFQLAWHEVEAICPELLNSEVIAAIQTQLNKLGYSCGTADGKLGPRTLQALATFQWENGLPVGAITGDTLQLLGIVHPEMLINEDLIRP